MVSKALHKWEQLIVHTYWGFWEVYSIYQFLNIVVSVFFTLNPVHYITTLFRRSFFGLQKLLL